METFWGEWKDAWIQMLLHPLWLGAVFLVAWQFVWKSLREKRTFSRRLSPPTPQFLMSLLWGIVAGGLLTPAFLWFPLSIHWIEVFWMWGMILILSCFRLRFACLAYSAGLLSLISLSWRTIGEPATLGTDNAIWNALYYLSVEDWMMVVVGLHLLEWLLVRVDGRSGSTPIYVKKGEEVLGGYRLQKIWPFPLLVPSPAGIIPLPVVAGFSRINLSRHPEQQKRRSSTLLLLYALILTNLMILSLWWEPCWWLTAVFAVLGHEALYLMGLQREKRRKLRYQAVVDGVKIWVVLPETPAASMGLKPGDTLLRVNNQVTRSEPELKAAIRQSAAFAKLELKDEHGEIKLAQTPVYEGAPPLLGIVPAPETDADALADTNNKNPAMPPIQARL
ncbi:PDZ domain-containing protein [Desmospora activa]|uniref:PDZ domain-containing protein n=1 Tax=Desmospora activa DSM 45169 TaxID=1121389 RepID=A0A2T4Z465_9BACL|nr:PDZ domain-containing protein [Desmospora activa]PTM56666.1 hypothetical protein C8J48_2991 [Desmospora activa DSM 45169]